MVTLGSCEPENSCYTYLLFTRNYQQVPLIPAKTDPAQVQIMRLMERQNWDCVYVVNFPDLCAGNIDTFKQLKKRLETSWNVSHSIFSETLIQEIEYLISEKAVFIAGGDSEFDGFFHDMGTDCTPFIRSSMRPDSCKTSLLSASKTNAETKLHQLAR